MKLIDVKTFSLKIWKDPVWSKVISTSIIFIFGAIWVRYNNYSFVEIYTFLILLLTFETPVYLFLSLLALYFLVKFLVRHLNPKADPEWEEQLGNYKFRELYEILKSQSLSIQTHGMQYSRMAAPKDNLFNLFLIYSIFLNVGVDVDHPGNDGGYLYGVFSPKMLTFGLVEKKEIFDNRLELTIIKYQTSELGYRFQAIVEKLTQKKRLPNI